MGVEADRPINATRVPTESAYGRVFWISVVVGWAVIVFGLVGAFVDRKLTHPAPLALWLVGSLVAHDAVIAPLVFVAAIALRRTVSAPFRRVVQFGLILSAIFVLVSIPVLGRFGARPDNPTLLAGNYAAALITVLGAVWAATIVLFVWTWWRGRNGT